MSIVIRGMRGNYPKFNRPYIEEAGRFNVEIEGVLYDQSFLYLMNDYFSYRFIDLLNTLEKINPEYAKAYQLIYKLF